MMSLWKESVGLVAYPWQNPERFKSLFANYKDQLIRNFPEVEPEHTAQYAHDIMVFDQGHSLPRFVEDAMILKSHYQGEDLKRALRTLAKTYWIKDEVFVSHQMISPVKLAKIKSAIVVLELLLKLFISIVRPLIFLERKLNLISHHVLGCLR